MPNVKKIWGLNRPGTPWACPGLLRDDLYLYSISVTAVQIQYVWEDNIKMDLQF